MSEINVRYQIYDLNNNLLVDDNVAFYRYYKMNSINEERLISFDGKYYFNLAVKNLFYKKIEDKSNDFNRVKFDIKKFNNYKIDLWHKISFDKEEKDNTVNIYIDYDINELDSEVKDLVDVLNKIPYVRTISSCSGHGKKPLYVGIEIKNISILIKLSKMIYDEFKKDFYITTDYNIQNYILTDIKDCFTFNLITYEKGLVAYEKAKLLKEKIQKYIEINYIDNNNLKEEVNILKNTLNNINGISVDMEKKNNVFEEYEIVLNFHNKKALDGILEILWNGFRYDFELRTKNNIVFVRNDFNEQIICFVLKFVMSITEMKEKVKLLNEALSKKYSDRK